MLEFLWNGLLTCLSPINALAIIISVILGIVVGALPGFGATIGMIIILPLTYTMDHSTALIALTGVYIGCEYGGSISSILLNTPGTNAAMVTTFDGFPMAQQGKARDALLISNIASFNGGIMSALSMLFFMPLLAPFVIKFGAAEIFILGAIGLYLVGSISSEDPFKGVASAVLGVFTTCIGVDSYVGNPRFTFDSIQLMGGIPFIPVMLAVFSLPSMLAIALGGESARGKAIDFKTVGIKDNISAFGKLFNLLFSKMKLLLLRSGIIGILVGIVPGVGASVATMLSYSVAKHNSKHPELYGKGSPEGIAAAECSNNALVGGSYIPVLALGIPGSASAAVFMAAIFMHGMTPGPNFLTNQAGIVYMVIVAILLCALVQLLLGLFTIGSLANILKVPTDKLFSAVLVICTMGAYVVRGLSFDIWIFIGFSIVAYFLIRLGLNPGSYTLGLILGPIVERSMMEAWSLAKAKGLFLYMLNRPIAQGMLVCICCYIIYSLWKCKKNRQTNVQKLKIGEIPSLLSGMRGADFFSALFLLPITIWLATFLPEYPPKTAFFPAIVLAILALLMLGLLIKTVCFPNAYIGKTQSPFADINWKGITTFALLLLLYAYLIDIIGFYTDSFIFIFVICLIMQKKVNLKNIALLLCFDVIFNIICYLIFHGLFSVATPVGIFI